MNRVGDAANALEKLTLGDLAWANSDERGTLVQALRVLRAIEERMALSRVEQIATHAPDADDELAWFRGRNPHHVRRLIHQVLEQATEPMTIAQVAEVIGAPCRGRALYRIKGFLGRLTTDGELERTGRGLYVAKPKVLKRRARDAHGNSFTVLECVESRS